jgi:pimeloyl-ACP methyl ester carboxylesterase
VSVRGLPHHVLVWGEPQPHQPPLVMLHGWMDVGASFQFVVDALPDDRWVLAPDWRGFGATPGMGESFWFPDYLADLEALLEVLAPGAAIDLVGHSMGGNVAMLYGGARPKRVRRLVNLEGFGLPATRPSQAPVRMAQWLDDLVALRRGDKALKTYPSRDAVAARLVKTNPRLPLDRALWLANHWAVERSPGEWHIRGDAGHKLTSPYLFRVEEMLAFYAHIQAPVLCVEGSDNQMHHWWPSETFTLSEYHERLKAVPQVTVQVVANAGHMLHHDQPETVARHIHAHLCG